MSCDLIELFIIQKIKVNIMIKVFISLQKKSFSLVYCPPRGLIFNIKIKINLFMHLARPPKKFPLKFPSLADKF